MGKNEISVGSMLILLLSLATAPLQLVGDRNYLEGRKIVESFFGYDEGYVVESRDCDRITKAIDLLRKGKDSDPTNGKAVVFLKKALELSQRCVQAVATRDFQGTDEEIQLAIKSVEPQVKEIEKEKQMLMRKALEVAPNDPEVLIEYAFEIRSNKNEALGVYRKVLAVDPENVAAHEAIAQIVGEITQAEYHYREAVKIMRLNLEKYPEARYLHALEGLANVLERKGEYDKAIEVWEEYYKRKPEQESFIKQHKIQPLEKKKARPGTGF